MKKITIPYKPRQLQKEIHDSLKRFNVLVCHRRFGKSVLSINENKESVKSITPFATETKY